MLPSTLRLCILEILSAPSVFGWSHVNKTKFNSTISRNDITLVAFVVPWTEPSKALESEWLSAAAQTKNALLSVDCEIEAALCEEYDVTSYPTIRLFKSSGDFIRYKGPRKASAIIPFLNRAQLPTVSVLDKSNIAEFRAIDHFVFIAYIPTGDETSKRTFTTLATRHHDKYTFGLTSDASLIKSASTTIPSITCINSLGGEQEILSGEAGLDAMEKFMEAATAPVIGEFTMRNELKYMKAGKSLVYFFASSPIERAAYTTSLNPLAKIYKEYLNFVTVDAVKYSHMLPGLGLKKESLPALAVFNPSFGQAFPFPGKEITAQTVEKFVLDIVGGKVKPLGGGEGEGHDEL